MLRSLSIKAIIFIAFCIAACSILKKEDTDQDILAFLSSFETSLTQPNAEILKQFEAKQSDESLLAVITILQNKESEFITCTTDYAHPQIIRSEEGVKVVLQAAFKSQNLEAGASENNEQATLTLFIKRKGKSHVITKIEGEDFYKAFAEIRNTIQWSVERIEEMKKREQVYALAKALEPTYDSVIWYASHEGKNYFYVTQGAWDNYFIDYRQASQTSSTKMGLADEAGKIIIPLEYDLVGTIGFDYPLMVEVIKEGKAGYFDLASQKLVVTPAYDLIIPYQKENAFAIVKRDSIYGWLDKNYQYKEGFPSKTAQAWVNSFSFLPPDLQLKSGNQTFCEVPHPDHAGYGIIMPPSYLVKTGLFSQIMGGITTTPVPLNGWTDYTETRGTLLQTVTDKINAVITTIRSRYTDGREEFYTSNRLVFVDPRNDTLAVADVISDVPITMKRINNDLLEIKSQDNQSYEGTFLEDYNVPTYAYFTLGEHLSVTPLKTNRMFAETQFVKLDSSYLTGKFNHYNAQTNADEETNFLGLTTLNYMRNEILASYGLIFADSAITENFAGNWYKPQYKTIEEFKDQITEIDRYNLAFLDRIIERRKVKPV